ncbi:hypothetical protein COV04_03315 [Candidatus Uhrbacteria bacterium CG10_big_fil_rev_8_21_14_0_10_48_11]|uniref:N-acetyltransferase domain-containing protein n=1 Tax=Candidatus Uhrbacteria bacterium CG10_big_fil_rev_8_21_14_0_10_48_11 TaxID=1975037 RepID=A0A2M8LE56_9BACT|nr:MAG: hypothetical protein COV04_03315 [Candidatus Uhrbacteria bacterium CG10_big_fil_rev_8_21_14_0_10_48_11]
MPPERTGKWWEVDDGRESKRKDLTEFLDVLRGGDTWGFKGYYSPVELPGEEREILKEELDRPDSGDKLILFIEGLRVYESMQGLTLEEVAKALEERGVVLSDSRFLAEALEQADFLVQGTIVELASEYLSDADFVQFIESVATNFRISYHKGVDTYDYVFGESNDREQSLLRGYAEPFFAELTSAIKKRQTVENIKALQDAFTDCLQRFIACEVTEQITFESWQSMDTNEQSARRARIDDPDFEKRLSRMRDYEYAIDPQESVQEYEERRGMYWQDFTGESVRGDIDDEFIGALNHVLANLKAVGGNERTIELLRTWLEVDPLANPMHVGEALSSIDAAASVEALLPLLRHRDPKVREGVTRALYRIELGSLPVSEKGVEYPGKQFDLGEFNNPRYSAARLTGDGQVGIFDDQGRLFKHFALEGLSGDSEVIRAKVFDFTVEMLFTSRGDETAEEQEERQQYLREFLEHYQDFFDSEFIQKTGVAWNNLSFPEQGQLLLFYRHSSSEEQERLITFVEQYGEEGFRSFLALDRLGQDAGERIITIGEQYPKQVGERGRRIAAGVFAKYSEIVLTADQIDKYLRDNYKKWGGDDVLSRRVTDKLLSRANDLILEFSNKSDDDSQEAKAGELEEKLRRVNADLVLFKSVFKSAFEEGESRSEPLQLEDIEGLVLESCKSSELHDEDKLTMREIFLEHRKKSRPEVRELALQEFVGEQGREDNVFYLLRKEEKVLSFVFMRPISADRVYMGGFNTNPELAGSAIGGVMFSELLERFSNKGVTVEIKVNPKLIPMFRHYLDDFQFVIESTDDDYKGTGETVHTLIRQPAQRYEQAA